jgi:cation diffusion facilitator family transporter
LYFCSAMATISSHHKELSEGEKNFKLAGNEGWVSIVVNIFLFILKYWAGIVTGSVAILADAWHTLSDSLSSVIVIIGAKVSAKPPDKEHPYGHGRAELVAAILIAALLGFVGYEFISDSIRKLIDKQEVVFGTLAFVATITSIILKEGLAQYAFWLYRKTGLTTLKADAVHHRTDAISSGLILIGILLGKYFWWIDGVMGIVVSIMILIAAYQILKEAVSPILGEAPDPAITRKLNQAATKVTSRDLHIHHVHLHTYGNHIELTFHINLPKEMSVEESHNLTEMLEKQIQIELNMVATIHVEPK